MAILFFVRTKEKNRKKEVHFNTKINNMDDEDGNDYAGRGV